MRHEALNAREPLDALDIAAVWPATTQIAPLPLPDIVEDANPLPAEAAPDMPVAAGAFLVVAYSAVLTLLAVATAGSGRSLLAIGVAVFFLFMFFSVPAVFLGIEREQGRRPTLARFLETGMQTLTGHSSGREALVQMLVVPVSLAFGVLCIAIATAIIL